MMTAETFLSGYDTKISILGLALREFLFLQLPGISEETDVSARLVAYSFGPGYKNVICVMIPSKKEIKPALKTLLDEARIAHKKRINQSH
jgi:hypothetical protein